MKSIKSLVSATLAVISMMALGCGESGPRLVSVSGKVSVDGKPMEGLVLSFLPDPSNPGALPSENEVAGDGTYTAYTQGRKGLMPGRYHVVILRGPAAAAIVKAEQSAANNETFKDDPFMAAASEAPAKKKDQKVLKFFEIAFDKVVPEEGGIMDFDGEMKNATPYK